MKPKNREQFLMLLTIAVIVLFVVVNFVLTPLAGWWSARQKQIHELQAKVRDGNSLVKREETIRSHWSEMQSNALPADTSAAEQQFLKTLDGWSRDAGTELTSIIPQWKSDSTNYLTLACRVEAAGDMGSLSRLLYDVEKGPVAVKLDSLELSARDATGQQMTVALEINGLALVANGKK